MASRASAAATRIPTRRAAIGRKGEAEVADPVPLPGIEGAEAEQRDVVGLEHRRLAHRRHQLLRPAAEGEGQGHPAQEAGRRGLRAC